MKLTPSLRNREKQSVISGLALYGLKFSSCFLDLEEFHSKAVTQFCESLGMVDP